MMTASTKPYIMKGQANNEVGRRRANVPARDTHRLDLRMYPKSTTPLFTFHHLSLREAEEELVSAAIDYEHALIELYGATRIRSFRSEKAYELNQISNILFAWHDRGLWHTLYNRERLEKFFDPYYIKQLCCPQAFSIEYAADLARAVVQNYTLHDEAFDATMRLQTENPFNVKEAPPPEIQGPPPLRRSQPPMRGGVS
jgi:hypothetical protein